MDHQAKTENDQEIIKSLTNEADASLKSLEWLDTFVIGAMDTGTSFPDDQRDLGPPKGFKIPNFDHFNGSGNPRAYLRAYCNQLVGNGRNEALLMRLFSRSLSRTAMEWFISQDISRWKTWEEMKLTETYREYARHWRDEAAHVNPPMIEVELVAAFIWYQKADCFDKMITMNGSSFVDLVAVRDDIEDSLKTDRIVSILNRAGQVENAPFMLKTPHQMMVNKEKEIVVVVQGMTRSGRCYAPEVPVLKAPRRKNPQKRPFTEGEAEKHLEANASQGLLDC
ncbi:uncharacterized protein LOC132601496 [Lycium barbarum]|uniref:uncharacterized protein LOC132601496 n=1 Tax=Lycium barbarum TaxID=112863 RepID=UPI00293EE48E|nr:uncharacterized protein LOC132601496 [Lycium barbarum]